MADLTGMMQAAAGSASGGENLYVEDVFSTYLYTGNGSTQTITNGIDLDGEGGLLWMKTRARSSGDFYSNHFLYDSARGLSTTSYLHTNLTDAQGATGAASPAPSFLSDGFTPGPQNQNTETYASWTFRKAPKFFDVVTYTGTGVARTVSHNLGSVPGCIIVKRTDSTGDWIVYHRANTANPETDYLELNDNAATADLNTMWNDTAPTSTEFTVGTDADVNASAATYVAYLFAHDAGGFGDDGEQNVISCGSYTGTGASQEIDLGFEPQWILIKNTSRSGEATYTHWYIHDNMRGIITGADDPYLRANTSDAETTSSWADVDLTPTGFKLESSGFAQNLSGDSYIYIAIRRGPMKTPTSGTEVFSVSATTTTTPTTSHTVGFPADFFLQGFRTFGISPRINYRLAGDNYFSTASTSSETSGFGARWDLQDNYAQSAGVVTTIANYFLKRAPGFFDVVCYTGNDVAGRNVNHNLGKAPELIIVKSRDASRNWAVRCSELSSPNDKYFYLNSSNQVSTFSGFWGTPTDTTFNLNTPFGETNLAGEKYVAYLFATLAGVSKVGSYTGTGTTLAIDCGFSAGARLVIIKRTDSTGDWYVWDSARGIVSGNDPYLLINSTAAEVTNTDYIDPSSAGFEISSTAPAAINASGGNFVFLAVA